MIWINSYSYNYLTHTLFVIHSAMVLISVPVGPHPGYDSDVVYSLLKLFIHFMFMTNYAHQVDIDICM